MGGKVGFCGIKKPQSGGLGLMSGFQPRGEFRSLALILSAHSAGIRIVTYGPERDCFYVWVETRGGHRVSKGDSAVCGRRPACAAGSRRATGPDPFVACGRDGCGGLGKKNQFTWEHASGELTFMR